MTAKRSRLSVVIPTLNEAGGIAAAVQSAFAGGASEVIVADGGSTDLTTMIARSAGAIVIDGPPGRGRQLHAGAVQTAGDVLLFLHADNRLPGPPLVPVLDQYHAAGCPRWGGLRQRIDAAGAVYRTLEMGNEIRIGLTGRVFGDQAMFVRRELYDAVGGFPAVPLMEDVMLSAALKQHHRPTLLPGPVQVDARRWQRRGIVRQTLLNWQIQYAFARGVSPERLARRYR